MPTGLASATKQMPNLQELISGPGVMWCSRVTYLTVLIGGVVDPFGLGAQHQFGPVLDMQTHSKIWEKMVVI